jgi:hypothetical protein
VLNNTALLFYTVSDMSRYLGRKALTDTGYVKKYMNPTKLYKDRYEFYYESDYTGPRPLQMADLHYVYNEGH